MAISEFGQRLRTARESCGLSQQQAASSSGIGYKSINNYENGASRPDVDKLAILCHIYQVSADQLLGLDQPLPYLTQEDRKLVEHYNVLNGHGKHVVRTVLAAEYERAIAWKETAGRIPLLCLVPVAKMGEGAFFSAHNYRYLDVPINEMTKSADFAIQLTTDEMEPVFFPGDILTLTRRPAEDNDVGAFLMNEVLLIRQIYKREDACWLRPFNLNREYIPVSPQDHFLCLGTVVGVLRGNVQDIHPNTEIQPAFAPADLLEER